MLTQLAHCLNADVSGFVDQAGRHRTLGAAIGWSYDLLDDKERFLFQELAVFSGGCDEQAAAVTETSAEAALSILAILARKHLVRLRRGGRWRAAFRTV